MSEARAPVAAFALAFNDRDLDRMKDLLAETATAVVLGAPFPEERGPSEIAATSLTHVLGDGTDPLRAEVFAHEGDRLVLFLTRTTPPQIDSAVFVHVVGAAIQRLEYVVAWHRPHQLAEIARARGLEAREPE